MSNPTVPQKGYKLPARRVAFGMMPRELMEFALPMDRPKLGEHIWTRRNGRVTYTVTAGAVPDVHGALYLELPSGRYARAALLYLFSESWVTERATVDLGMCTHQYLAALGVSKGGVTYREAVRQLNLVAAAQFTIQVDAETTEDDAIREVNVIATLVLIVLLVVGVVRFVSTASASGPNCPGMDPSWLGWCEQVRP